MYQYAAGTPSCMIRQLNNVMQVKLFNTTSANLNMVLSMHDCHFIQNLMCHGSAA